MKNNNENLLGQIISGSFSKGLELKLTNKYDIENIRIGKFVIIQGEKAKYFSMVSDRQLETSNEKFLNYIPAPDENFIKDVLMGTSVFGIIKLTPYLTVENKSELKDNDYPLKVKTIPPHFSIVNEASKGDIEEVFGKEEEFNKNFHLGFPAEMETPLCINLEKFIQRSNGIFGKSGTGKSFLSRILLSGILKKDVASILVFDMHNEYGWEGTNEENLSTKGLKQLFGDKVEVFTLDPQNKSYTFKDAIDLEIAYNQIEIEDLELIRNEMSLTDAMLDHLRIIEKIHEKSWLKTINEMTYNEMQEFCTQNNANLSSLAALQRKINSLISSVSYLKPVTSTNGINTILKILTSGKSVVLQFGRLNNIKSYLLASNIITRQIHNAYRDITEKYLHDRTKYKQPKRLVICIEEAHKFLSKEAARSGTFGTIARELRKYNVTLLIVDQRPSGIDDEVMSQIGTRATLLLNDENDIKSVFVGESGIENLKGILSQLNPKQEVLMFGYAMPMPIVIRARKYDSNFYKTMSEEISLSKEAKIRRGELAAAEL